MLLDKFLEVDLLDQGICIFFKDITDSHDQAIVLTN